MPRERTAAVVDRNPSIGVGRISRQAADFPGKNHAHRETAFAQVACGDESVAAVVARPGENEHCATFETTRAMSPDRRRPAGTLHQRLIAAASSMVRRSAARYSACDRVRVFISRS
jgi:hypothetical protein